MRTMFIIAAALLAAACTSNGELPDYRPPQPAPLADPAPGRTPIPDTAPVIAEPAPRAVVVAFGRAPTTGDDTPAIHRMVQTPTPAPVNSPTDAWVK